MNGTCLNKPCINIKNIKNGETVTYSLVLLHGNVQDVCECTTKIKILNENNCENSEFNVSKTSGQFKCIINLAENQNKLILSYCNSIKTIILHFRPERLPKYSVRLLYIVCKGHNGNFQSPHNNNNETEACRKIFTVARLIQCLVAEKLHEHNLGRKTFYLCPDECKPFYSQLSVAEAHQMTQHELWNYFAREIISKIDSQQQHHEKYVAFLGCTEFQGIDNGNYSDQNIKMNTRAHVALGGGDLALFGSGCLYTWPSTIGTIVEHFENDQKIDRSTFMDDSNSRGTFGGCFATTLGSVTHEIGHIFDLGHTIDGIMGNGFDYVNRVFTIDNLTEILPVRQSDHNAMIAMQSTVRPRLTTIRKENPFLMQYHCQKNNDLTYFAWNSAITLAVHKWIGTPKISTNQPVDIEYNVQQRMITSKAIPLHLIEFRDLKTAVARYFFSFDNKPVCYQFEIPHFIEIQLYESFVIDANGNVRKFHINETAK